ncbi:MAG: thioredoxin family protein [Fibrobacteraceae bacterium]|nr:thioredoxin family protein [Fibrobacteraceae bacterium]
MSRIFVALAAVLLCASLGWSAKMAPSEVRWMDYSKALDTAKVTPKLILVSLYADWCIPCLVMEKTVYSDASVVGLLNSRFYPVRLNAESQDSIICDGHKKTVNRCFFDVWELNALPAFVLVAPKGMSILTVVDSMSPDEMQLLLYQFIEKQKEWFER